VCICGCERESEREREREEERDKEFFVLYFPVGGKTFEFFFLLDSKSK